MEAFIILVYLILFSGAVGYGAWRLYRAIDSITSYLWDLQTNKHSRLTSYLDNIRTAIYTSKSEITTSIRNSDKAIKTHVSSENNAIKQMIMAQFSSQTAKLVKDVEINRHNLSNLVGIVQNFQNQTNNGIKENSNKIGELNNSVSHAISESTNRINETIQQFSNDEQQHSQSLQAGIDMVFRNVTDFNKTIERHLTILEESDDKNTKRLDANITSLAASLKLHTEEITSSCNQMINTDRELHQKTRSSFDLMNDNLSKYLSQLKQFDALYNNLQKLYAKLLEQEEVISGQEFSLTGMVARHSQIFEITSEMNKTASEIFEFMKLYLIQSTIDNLK